MPTETKRLNVFERYLTLWVALCMVAGVVPGRSLQAVVGVLVEVPVMLSVCRVCMATKHWFAEASVRT